MTADTAANVEHMFAALIGWQWHAERPCLHVVSSRATWLLQHLTIFIKTANKTGDNSGLIDSLEW
jgi:hypothetical protein